MVILIILLSYLSWGFYQALFSFLHELDERFEKKRLCYESKNKENGRKNSSC